MHTAQEYLVSHGLAGALGRFGAEPPADYRRGDRVVVESPRGLELGTVLCPASERQRRVLSHTPVGRLLRPAGADDLALAEQRRELGRRLGAEASTLARRLSLPLEILDAEIMLDGRQALLQCLAGPLEDLDDFVTPLEAQFHVRILLENLAVAPPAEKEEHGGCGKPGCGHAAGGCSSCGSGGGCSSCGSGKVDMRDYFAHLRARMEERLQRTPLL